MESHRILVSNASSIAINLPFASETYASILVTYMNNNMIFLAQPTQIQWSNLFPCEDGVGEHRKGMA